MMVNDQTLIEVAAVKKMFRQGADQELLVLDEVNLTLNQGEIVALLGRSGSGKSTLLRIIAGLTAANGGEVRYRGQMVHQPHPGIAMVFQKFALLPWLDVMQNVELGLEALGVPRQERRQRVLKAIDMIGLDGFESAFPRELSGGMQQRVGVARALVVNPDILLMDEPFSALDVLTAENLRNDLLELWQQKQMETNCILLVTHNIDEAVLMADRIIIFDNNPGRVLQDLTVNLPRPRDEESPEFRFLVEQVYRVMTGASDTTVKSDGDKGFAYRLPDASISELAGFMEALFEEGAVDKLIPLSELAEIIHYDIDDLFPLTEVLTIMEFTNQQQSSIELTVAGKHFAQADMLEQKRIFAKHLLSYIPLARHIRSVLSMRLNHKVSKKYFLAELEDSLSAEDAERVLRIIIEWGRYAEIFAYDDSDGKLSLENPE